MNASCCLLSAPPALPNSSEHLPAPSFSNQSSSGFCEQVVIQPEVFLALGILSLLENVLVILAVARNGNLHSPMYLFLCSLAVADLLVSVSNALETIMIAVVNSDALTFEDQFVQHMDNVFDSMICISLVASICNLLAIAVDRYVTIFYALRYHSIVTLPRAGRAIAAIWAGSVLSSTLFIAYYHHTAVLLGLVSFFVAMLALMAVLYVHMLARACQHGRHIARLHKTQHPTRQGCGLKGAATLTILLGVFLLCWAPFFLHLSLVVLCPQHPTCGCVFKNVNLFLALVICNSIVDPLIYAFRSQELRKTLQEVLQCSW